MSNEKAFPSKTHLGDYDRHEVNKGMDLRDYFAAKAMQSLLTHVADTFTDPDKLETLVENWVEAYGEDVTIRQGVAKDSYQMADAMMEARK